VAVILLLLIHIPDRTVKSKEKSTIISTLDKLDVIGFVLFAPAAIQLLLALQWGGNRFAWNSATTIGLLVGAAATFCLFMAWEYRKGEGAMIPLSLIRKRIVWASCVNMFFFMGSMMIVVYYLPIYFQAVKGVSPTRSGVDVLPGILTQMLAAIVSGVLGISPRNRPKLTNPVSKLGYYLPWAIASGALAATANGLFSTFSPSTSVGAWVGYQMLSGIARGCGMQMVSPNHDMNWLILQSLLLQSRTPFLLIKCLSACQFLYFVKHLAALCSLHLWNLFSATDCPRALPNSLLKLMPNQSSMLVREPLEMLFRQPLCHMS
jgi:hypothetical protein